ncbi:hypothetical protein H4218_004366 [Coemansia sp. IMI 209128]|nr:hypothetical protein H4218_004366 [Coemansia sp. IMI 209128]
MSDAYRNLCNDFAERLENLRASEARTSAAGATSPRDATLATGVTTERPLPHASVCDGDSDGRGSDVENDDAMLSLEPADFEEVMRHSRAGKSTQWKRSREVWVPNHPDLQYLAYKGELGRDIAQAKIPGLEAALTLDEALSQSYTLALFARAAISEMGEQSVARERTEATLDTQIRGLRQTRDKHRAAVKKQIGKAVPAYQVMLDMERDETNDHGSDGLTDEMHARYIRHKEDNRLAELLSKQKHPQTANPAKSGFTSGKKTKLQFDKSNQSKSYKGGDKFQSNKATSDKQPSKQ